VTLHELNALGQVEAQAEFTRCCGSKRWAAGMAGNRPFHSVDEVQRVAEELWWLLEGADWLEAFSHHPRIGERAAGWEKDEQAGARGAPEPILKRLTKLNSDYERKFGHVFLIFATGKNAEEMLAELERRIGNDPAAELRIAATEQAKITRLRLQKLLSPSFESPRAR
jgi:OHCU decarboxylase